MNIRNKKGEVTVVISGNDSVPRSLDIKYSHDYDILNLHNVVVANIRRITAERITRISSLITIKEEELKVTNYVNRSNIQLSLEELKRSYSELLSNKDYNTYISESRYLLEAYKDIGKISSTVDITTGNIINRLMSREELKIRHTVIPSYLTIASRYMTLNIIRTIDPSDYCECGEDISSIPQNVVGSRICSHCGHTNFGIYIKNYKISGTSERNTENTTNFVKALSKIQGKCDKEIPDELYTEIDDYFKDKGLIRDVIRSRELVDDVIKKRRGTNIHMMLQALKSTNNNDYYSYVHTICRDYWDWILPDFSILEASLTEIYYNILLIKRSLSPKITNRSSSLNIWFVVYKLLVLKGVNISKEDLKYINTKSTIDNHERLWRIICDIYHNNNPNIYYLST